MDSKRLELALRLKDWAIDTMHYQTTLGNNRPDDPFPSLRDFQDLCRGMTIDIWEFLIDHVAPEGHVKMVKRRLEAEEEAQRERGDRLELSRHDDSRRFFGIQLEARRRDVEQLRQQLSELHRDLGKAEQERRVVEGRIREQQVKVAMLDSFREGARRQFAVLSEYRARLSDCLGNLSRSKRDLNACEGMLGVAAEATSVLRGMPDAFLHESSHLLTTDSLHANSGNLASLERLACQCAQTPLDFKAELARAASDHLSELQLSRAPRSLPPTTTDHGRFPSAIEERLRQQEESHVRSFAEALRIKHEYELLRRRVDRLFEARLSSRHKLAAVDGGESAAAEDGDERALIDALQRLEIDLAAERATADVTHKAILSSIEQKSRLEKGVSAFKRGRRRLQQLLADNHACQVSIDQLLDQQRRYEFEDQFECRLRSVRHFCQVRLGVRREPFEFGGAVWHQRGRAELELFEDVLLEPDSSDFQSLRLALSAALKLPLYRTLGELSERVADAVSELDRAEAAAGVSRSECERRLQAIEGELDRVRGEERESGGGGGEGKLGTKIADTICAALEVDCQAVRHQIEACASVKEACAALWAQPAQHLAPWVKVDGKTFEACKTSVCALLYGGDAR